MDNMGLFVMDEDMLESRLFGAGEREAGERKGADDDDDEETASYCPLASFSPSSMLKSLFLSSLAMSRRGDVRGEGRCQCPRREEPRLVKGPMNEEVVVGKGVRR